MNIKTISTILTLALTLGLCQTAAPTEAATKSQTVDCVRQEIYTSYSKEKGKCKSKGVKRRKGKNFLQNRYQEIDLQGSGKRKCKTGKDYKSNRDTNEHINHGANFITDTKPGSDSQCDTKQYTKSDTGVCD